MRTRRRPLSTLAALATCAAALVWSAFVPTPAIAQSGFEEEVGQMVDLVVDSWNEGDPEDLAGLFLEDADLRSASGEWINGREAIKGYFEEWMSRRDGAKEVLVQHQRILGEGVAAVDVLSAVVPEGADFWDEEVERLAISVDVVQLRDGSWRFATWRECHGGK